MCLNKDVYSSQLKVIRDHKSTKGVRITIFMQGTYQLEREINDVEIMLNDSCQVRLGACNKQHLDPRIQSGVFAHSRTF